MTTNNNNNDNNNNNKTNPPTCPGNASVPCSVLATMLKCNMLATQLTTLTTFAMTLTASNGLSVVMLPKYVNGCSVRYYQYW